MSLPSRSDLNPLLRLVARLRGPGGCPSDQALKLDDLRPYLLEESHELAAALDERSWREIGEELGDLLFQVALIAELGREQGALDIGDVIERIESKMVERHPHVFGDLSLGTADEVASMWERRKAAQRDGDESHLDGVSKSLPSLVGAFRLTEKAAAVGFDWHDASAVVDKVEEELAELRQALDGSAQDREEEVGDLLFAIVNLSRHLGVDPEGALARCNLKFRRRFRYIEENLGKSLAAAELAELEALWQQAKERERSPGSGSRESS